MLQINELFLCCLPLQCLLLNFVSIDYRKWLSSKKLFNFYLFVVSLGQVYFVFVLALNNHRDKTDIQKWLRPGLVETVYRPDSYAMLMSANKGETASHGYHCPGDMAVCMREVLARPWIGACVPLALSLS